MYTSKIKQFRNDKGKIAQIMRTSFVDVDFIDSESLQYKNALYIAREDGSKTIS